MVAAFYLQAQHVEHKLCVLNIIVSPPEHSQKIKKIWYL